MSTATLSARLIQTFATSSFDLANATRIVGEVKADLDEARNLDGAADLVASLEDRYRRVAGWLAAHETAAAILADAERIYRDCVAELERATLAVEGGSLDRKVALKMRDDLDVATQAERIRRREVQAATGAAQGPISSILSKGIDKWRNEARLSTSGVTRMVRQPQFAVPLPERTIDPKEIAWWVFWEQRALGDIANEVKGARNAQERQELENLADNLRRAFAGRRADREREVRQARNQLAALGAS